MTSFLIPTATCIFLYAFYTLMMHKKVEPMPFIMASVFASGVVGLIDLLSPLTI